MICNARCGSGSASLKARLAIAIERLLERRLTKPAIGRNERLVGAGAPGDVGVDQLLDCPGHVIGHNTMAENVPDRGVLRAVAAHRDLVEFGALLFDAQDADVADVM